MMANGPCHHDGESGKKSVLLLSRFAKRRSNAEEMACHHFGDDTAAG